MDEPEIHLHPRTQGRLLRALLALPDLFSACAMKLAGDTEAPPRDPGAVGAAALRLFVPQLVIETHSEAFLRAAQEGLRGGTLAPEDVAFNVVVRQPGSMNPVVIGVPFGADGLMAVPWPGSFPAGDAGETH